MMVVKFSEAVVENLLLLLVVDSCCCQSFRSLPSWMHKRVSQLDWVNRKLGNSEIVELAMAKKQTDVTGDSESHRRGTSL
jgi:hypothetical protein